MGDGMKIATTLILPAGPTPPGGRTARMGVHGLGDTRATTTAFARRLFVPHGYAAPAFEARGQGDDLVFDVGHVRGACARPRGPRRLYLGHPPSPPLPGADELRCAGGRGAWFARYLSARKPAGQALLVSDGSAPLRAGRQRVTIRLFDVGATIPAGSRLELTLAARSTAQSAATVVYPGTSLPARARAALGDVEPELPLLAHPPP